MEKMRRKQTVAVTAISVIVLLVILIGGIIWMVSNAHRDAAEAARSVSLLYLDELASRREEVVEENLRSSMDVIRSALEMITDEDLSDIEHLRNYQRRVKRLSSLKRFAFVDEDGLVYTADEGVRDEMDRYPFDQRTLAEPGVFVRDLSEREKKAVIAYPIRDRNISVEGRPLVVCFMEQNMASMLQGISMTTQSTGITFTNIYTSGGVALSNTVLGGLAVEDNLLEALDHADYREGSSSAQVRRDFSEGMQGSVSFTYNGTEETLSYVPVKGTDWMLTYLVREKTISDRIESVTGRIINRSVLQSVLTAAVMGGMFLYIMMQNRRTARLTLEKERSEAENRVKDEEMAQRLALQEELLEQRRALREALDSAEQASKAKTVFLSNMSHEIRTPMNAIIGLDNIALNEPDLPENTRGYLEKIGDSARHLLGLINDILDMSRIESGRLDIRDEEFCFREMLEQVNSVIDQQCREKGIQYECRTAGRIDDRYIGDETKLRQVMINILGNAVKFTPEGGTVTALIEEGKRFGGKAVLKMTFRDTGIGMSPEFLPRLFDPFSQENASATSKYGSTGLGMAITKSIVELMNGTIGVESEKGRGTTFVVTVTLEEVPEEQDKTPEPEETEAPGDGGKPQVSLQGRKVLLAEDVEVNAEIMVMVLSMRGIEADVAENGRIALEKYTAHPAGTYDAVLMDMRMPEMDGLEATRRIRASGREDAESIPIIALTANAFVDDVERSIQAGLNAHLSKPVEPETLFSTLENLIRP